VPSRRSKDFYNSVHLSGSGAAAEAAAQREREKADWESKVVVDNVKFQPFVGPKTLTQLDKVHGILEGPVQKKSLRIVHNAKLPSGKRTAPPVAAPVTITTDPYTPPRDFAASFGVRRGYLWAGCVVQVYQVRFVGTALSIGEGHVVVRCNGRKWAEEGLPDHGEPDSQPPQAAVLAVQAQHPTVKPSGDDRAQVGDQAWVNVIVLCLLCSVFLSVVAQFDTFCVVCAKPADITSYHNRYSCSLAHTQSTEVRRGENQTHTNRIVQTSSNTLGMPPSS
jgi:hypothetical protein